MVIKNWLSKKYSDEMHILDGILISLFVMVFIISNFETLSGVYFVDLILLLFMLITVFLISILTIKNVIVNIDEMQISFCFIMSLALTLFNQFFFVGIVAYWIFFAYFMTFTGVFFRNLLMKIYFNEKKISW